jgi:hypothetical protein
MRLVELRPADFSFVVILNAAAQHIYRPAQRSSWLGNTRVDQFNCVKQ